MPKSKTHIFKVRTVGSSHLLYVESTSKKAALERAQKLSETAMVVEPLEVVNLSLYNFLGSETHERIIKRHKNVSSRSPWGSKPPRQRTTGTGQKGMHT